MGKLHTLKRAVRRDPAKWRRGYYAYFSKATGQWEPGTYYGGRDYRPLIRKLLGKS